MRGPGCPRSQALLAPSSSIRPGRAWGGGSSPARALPWLSARRPPPAPQSHGQTGGDGGMRRKECGDVVIRVQGRDQRHTLICRSRSLFTGRLPSEPPPRTPEQGTLSISRGSRRQVPGWEEAARASRDAPETAVGLGPGEGGGPRGRPLGGPWPARRSPRPMPRKEATSSLPEVALLPGAWSRPSGRRALGQASPAPSPCPAAALSPAPGCQWAAPRCSSPGPWTAAG